MIYYNYILLYIIIYYYILLYYYIIIIYIMSIEKKALLIGINYIGTRAQLNGCINDVIHMKNFLIQNYEFNPKNIIILSETSDKKNPTKHNILKYIDWLMKNNNENSRLFFHYSGHVTYIEDKNNDEIDGKDECICPVDFQSMGLITDDCLRKLLVDNLHEGAKLTCIFDCCHSGTVLDLRCNYRVQINKNNIDYNIHIDKHYQPSKGDIIFISGCKDDQTSADAWEENKFQGAMTYCLLKTIEKLKNKNKQPTIANVIKNLQKFIKIKGYKQIPQLSTGKIIDISQVFTVI